MYLADSDITNETEHQLFVKLRLPASV